MWKIYICLFVPLENSSHMETSHIEGCSAALNYDHWAVKVFSVPHLLWHGAPVTLTPIVERLAVELSLPVFTTWVCRGWEFEHQTFRLRRERSNRLRHHSGLKDPYQDSKQHSTNEKLIHFGFPRTNLENLNQS